MTTKEKKRKKEKILVHSNCNKMKCETPK